MTFDPVSTPNKLPGARLPPALHAKWGWIVAFGAVTAVLGLVALSSVVLATVASVFAIGVVVILAGGIEIGIGLNAHAWGPKALWIVVGLLYILSGAFALAQPLLAATVFTLLIGASLLATGVVRVIAGLQMHGGPKAFVIVAGVVTTLLGILILAGWPASSLVVLGTFLGIDLLFYGLTWIGVGLRLRNG